MLLRQYVWSFHNKIRNYNVCYSWDGMNFRRHLAIIISLIERGWDNARPQNSISLSAKVRMLSAKDEWNISKIFFFFLSDSNFLRDFTVIWTQLCKIEIKYGKCFTNVMAYNSVQLKKERFCRSWRNWRNSFRGQGTYKCFLH